MAHFVYILYSEKVNKYYVGSSHDPSLRLLLHNQGATRSTKAGIPWKLAFIEKHVDKSAALKREKEIKRQKSRKYIEQLIQAG